MVRPRQPTGYIMESLVLRESSWKGRHRVDSPSPSPPVSQSFMGGGSRHTLVAQKEELRAMGAEKGNKSVFTFNVPGGKTFKVVDSVMEM